MKKYFHKLTAMLLAAAIAVPMVPPVTAYADNLALSLSGLNVTVADVDSDSADEYVYQYTNVEASPAAYKTLIIMIVNPETGEVIDLPNKPGFTVIDDITNADAYKRIKIDLSGTDTEVTNNVEQYIEGITYSMNDAEENNVDIFLSTKEVAVETEDVTSGKMVYWDGHFYEYREIEGDTWPKWETAFTDAKKQTFLGRQGYLATITSKAEHDSIKLLREIDSNAKTGAAVWLGGMYLKKGDSYGNVTSAETNNGGSGWYWVSEPDANVRRNPFLTGEPKLASTSYDYGTVQGDLHFWSGCAESNCNCNTFVKKTEDNGKTFYQGPNGRTEPNNSAGTNLTDRPMEKYLQMTAAGNWNDLRGAQYTTDSTKADEENNIVYSADPGADIPKGYIIEYGDAPEEQAEDVAFAKAKLDVHTVTFSAESDGGSIDNVASSMLVADGATVNASNVKRGTGASATDETVPAFNVENVLRDNYTFSGKWYKDTNKANEYTFDTAVTADITVHAGWIGNPEVIYDGDGEGKTAKDNTHAGPFDLDTNITIDSQGGEGKYRYSGDGEDKDYNTTTTVTVTLAAAGKTLTLYNPTKAGYVFTGWTYTEATKTFTANWAADATVTYTKYNTNGTTAPATDAETIATYPEWYGDTNITLDTDGGTYQGDNLTAADYIKLNPDVAGGHHITLAEAEKEGHTFWGWHYTNSAHRFEAKWQENAVVNYKNTANVTGDHLKEIPVSYDSANPNQLVIDLNGGSSFTLNGETKITGQPVNMTSGVRYEIGDAVHPESKTFAGWKHSKPGDTLPDSSTANKHTLTALWAESAQVNYYAYKNSDEKPDLVNRQTTGYLVTFPEAKGKVYFDAKGTSVDGKYKHGDAEAAATGSIVLNPNVPETVVLGIPYSESNGYTFWGWKYDGTNEENRTFTAMWKKKSTVEYLEYSSQTTKTINNIDVTGNSTTNNLVTLDLDGGTYAGGQTTFNMNAGEDYVIDNSKVTKTGFEFKGWSLDNTGVKLNAIWYKQPVVSYLKNEYGQVDNAPYAIGTSITVTLAADETGSYVLNGTEYDLTSGTNKTITLAKDAVLTLNTPVKEGSTFTGWTYTEATKTFTANWDQNPAVSYTEAVTGKNADDTYQKTSATPNTDALIGSKIKVDLNDAAATVKYQVGSAAETTFTATESDDDFEITVVKDNNITLNDPSTSGKVFMGWTKSGNPDSVVYTAKWEADVKCAAGTGSDGIPDKFQRTVTFAVTGGSLTNPADATTFVTLTEADGITWSESGSATVTFPTGKAAAIGYKDEHGWTYQDGSSTVVTNDATAKATKDRLTFTFVYNEANKQAVKFAGTARNDVAPDENKLADSGATNLLYNGKIKLYGNGIADSEYTITDAADQRIDDPTSMPDGMDFFMGWVPVTPIPEGYVYALKATWDVDDINAADDKTTGGDNIPDSYQKVVTFKVVNGIFGTSGNVTEINDYVTLTRDGSADGIWDANGKAVVDIPADMKANHGYRPTGSWDVSALNGAEEVEVTGDETFTYTYLRKPSSSSTVVTPPAAPEEPEVPSVTPSRDYNIPEQLVEEHISYITGYEDGTVRPNNLITRAEVATILYNLLTDEMRTQYHTDENEFTDVPEHMWFNVPISTLVDMLLLSGYDDGTFGPNKYITRAEMAAILARFQVDLPLKDDVEFNDIDASWAKDQIIMVARRGWINGYPDGSYRPNANITRAETMAMINNMLHRNPKTLDDLHVDPKYWEDNSKLDEWYYIHVQEATKTHSHDRNEHGFEIRG